MENQWRVPFSVTADRAESGSGTPAGTPTDGGGVWCIMDGKGGTRGVATGMAARLRRGRLWDAVFRWVREPTASIDEP